MFKRLLKKLYVLVFLHSPSQDCLEWDVNAGETTECDVDVWYRWVRRRSRRSPRMRRRRWITRLRRRHWITQRVDLDQTEYLIKKKITLWIYSSVNRLHISPTTFCDSLSSSQMKSWPQIVPSVFYWWLQSYVTSACYMNNINSDV